MLPVSCSKGISLWVARKAAILLTWARPPVRPALLGGLEEMSGGHCGGGLRADGGDPLDESLGIAQEAVLVRHHPQPGAGGRQFAGLEQEIGPGGLSHLLVARGEGFIE